MQMISSNFLNFNQYVEIESNKIRYKVEINENYSRLIILEIHFE